MGWQIGGFLLTLLSVGQLILFFRMKKASLLMYGVALFILGIHYIFNFKASIYLYFIPLILMAVGSFEYFNILTFVRKNYFFRKSLIAVVLYFLGFIPDKVVKAIREYYPHRKSFYIFSGLSTLFLAIIVFTLYPHSGERKIYGILLLLAGISTLFFTFLKNTGESESESEKREEN